MARPRRVALTKGDEFWCNRPAFSMLQGQAAAPCADRQTANASTASMWAGAKLLDAWRKSLQSQMKQTHCVAHSYL